MEKNTITTKYQQNSHTDTPTHTYIYIIKYKYYNVELNLLYKKPTLNHSTSKINK